MSKSSISKSEYRERWEGLPSDPDSKADLGYKLADWSVIKAQKDGRNHLMFLPEDEEILREEAFIVADSASVCDIDDWQ